VAIGAGKSNQDILQNSKHSEAIVVRLSETPLGKLRPNKAQLEKALLARVCTFS